MPSGIPISPYLVGVTPGTAAASKAVVLDADSKIDELDITALKIGGSEVQVPPANSFCSGVARITRAMQQNADGSMQIVPPCTPKHIMRTASSFPIIGATSILDDTHRLCIGVAPIAGYTIHISADHQIVYKRNIAGTYTTIATISETFAVGANKTPAFVEMDDGTWLLWFTNYVVAAPACHYTYRSTAGGATVQSSWTLVNGTTLEGSPAYGSVHGSISTLGCWHGTYICYGEYNTGDDYGTPAKIYLSRNSGITWEVVGAVANVHWHFFAFGYDGDTNTIFGTAGDHLKKIYKFTYANGEWDAGVELISEDNGENCWLIPLSSTKILQSTIRLITEIDTVIRSRIIRMTLPIPIETGTNYSYDYGALTSQTSAADIANDDNPAPIDAGINTNGLIYAAFYSMLAGATHDGSGLYVSADDGLTWSCVQRTVGDRGFYELRGVFDGKIWGNYVTGDDASWDCHTFPVLNGAIVNAIHLSSQQGNRIAALEDATFTKVDGTAHLGHWAKAAWAPMAPPVFVAQSTGGCDGGACAKITTKTAAQCSEGAYQNTVTLGPICATVGLDTPVACILDTPIPENAYFMAKLKIKAPNAPNDYLAYLRFGIGYGGEGLYTQANSKWGSLRYNLGPEWQEMTLVGKMDATYNAVDHAAYAGSLLSLNLIVQPANSLIADSKNFDVFIDDVRFYWSATRILDSGNDNVLPGPTAGLDIATVPLTGLGASWTVAFDCIHPAPAEYGLATAAAGALAPVLCSIIGANGKHNDVGLVMDTNKLYYRLSDGASNGDDEITVWPRHYDQNRVYLVGNATTVTGYVFTPSLGLLTLEKTSDAPMPNPIGLILGGNYALAAASSCPGDYWGVRTWTTALDEEDITADLAEYGPSLYTVDNIATTLA